MTNRVPEDEFFERLSAVAETAEAAKACARSQLKAKIYSALARAQAASGSLLSLKETKADGRGLCVFEETVQVLPIGEKLKTINLCRVCHARILAEKVDKAPIYWRNCPYVGFQNS